MFFHDLDRDVFRIINEHLRKTAGSNVMSPKPKMACAVLIPKTLLMNAIAAFGAGLNAETCENPSNIEPLELALVLLDRLVIFFRFNLKNESGF